MTSLFAYLHNNLQVTPGKDDQVEVTVTLSSDLFLDYIRILDSLNGFVRKINCRAKLARIAEPAAPSEIDHWYKARYYERIPELFDQTPLKDCPHFNFCSNIERIHTTTFFSPANGTKSPAKERKSSFLFTATKAI